MTISDPFIVNLLLIPFVSGVAIPFLTSWITAKGLPTIIETLINAGLSAVSAAIITVSFDGDWEKFLLAFGVAWVASLRSHYTQLPIALYSKRVNGPHKIDGRHEKD